MKFFLEKQCEGYCPHCGEPVDNSNCDPGSMNANAEIPYHYTCKCGVLFTEVFALQYSRTEYMGEVGNNNGLVLRDSFWSEEEEVGYDKQLYQALDNDNVSYMTWIATNKSGRYIIYTDAGNTWCRVIFDSDSIKEGGDSDA